MKKAKDYTTGKSVASILDEPIAGGQLTNTIEVDLPNQELNPFKKAKLVTLPEGAIDPRLKKLSYSSLLTLHVCPRKYQLYKLNTTLSEAYIDDQLQQLTFDYGTVVGLGIQDLLEGKSLDTAIFNMFLAWEGDLLIENLKQQKSFYLAVFAVQKFAAMQEIGYLQEYELVIYKDKPAVELSFEILLPGGFTYRGHVDAVLRHKTTGNILVLECKTSSSETIQAVVYKNSSQAIGYSIVLDMISPEYSSYEVLYLVYSTKTNSYTELPFAKTLYQRAAWLQELVLDIKAIEAYEEVGHYPMHGESCNDYFRECEYYGVCTMSMEYLAKPLTEKMLGWVVSDSDKYEIKVTFDELLEVQLGKGDSEND